MQSFSICDLHERTGDLSRAAEEGELSLVTLHGHPLFISVPFNQHVSRLGIPLVNYDASELETELDYFN